MTCRVCGRSLDDCGTCACATERRTRAIEPGLIGAMAQDRRVDSLDEREHARRRDDPLRLAEWRTILDQAEKRAACPDCDGSGRVAVHVCRDERECRALCLRVEACGSCLGEGKTA